MEFGTVQAGVAVQRGEGVFDVVQGLFEPQGDAALYGVQAHPKVGDLLLAEGDPVGARGALGGDALGGRGVGVGEAVEPVLQSFSGRFERGGIGERAAGTVVAEIVAAPDGILKCGGRCAGTGVDTDRFEGVVEVAAGSLAQGALAAAFGLRGLSVHSHG
ncbi:hypothetical protein [Streptomyces hirsutus]|uniref:hypothetical protein n=1 Tax=Streptomyces hirsutus TaxID=35620 RepID=UPI0036BF171C